MNTNGKSLSGGYTQAKNDYSNNKVLNMVRDSGLNLLDLPELLELKKEKKDLFVSNQKKLFEEKQRKWLKNRDKEQFIDFNDAHRKKMKTYFNSLDAGNSI